MSKCVWIFIRSTVFLLVERFGFFFFGPTSVLIWDEEAINQLA